MQTLSQNPKRDETPEENPCENSATLDFRYHARVLWMKVVVDRLRLLCTLYDSESRPDRKRRKAEIGAEMS